MYGFSRKKMGGNRCFFVHSTSLKSYFPRELNCKLAEIMQCKLLIAKYHLTICFIRALSVPREKSKYELLEHMHVEENTQKII